MYELTKNFRPANTCIHCVYWDHENERCSKRIPSLTLPGVPETISMRNAVCDEFKPVNNNFTNP